MGKSLVSCFFETQCSSSSSSSSSSGAASAAAAAAAAAATTTTTTTTTTTLCMYLLTLCVNKKQTVLWLQLLEGVLTVGFASC